jgi:hypothetical protein
MNDVPLREFVEAIVREHEKRFDDLREADLNAFEQYKIETGRALELAKTNADRWLATLLSTIAIVTSFIAVVLAYYRI